MGMSNVSGLDEIDPVVVPIVEDLEMTFDEWLTSLHDDQPFVLTPSAAELLAAARAETE